MERILLNLQTQVYTPSSIQVPACESIGGRKARPQSSSLS